MAGRAAPAWCTKPLIADHPDLSGWQVYACGNPLMVEAARRDFAARLRAAGRRVLRDAFTPAAPAGTPA